MRVSLPRGWSIEIPDDFSFLRVEDDVWEAHDKEDVRHVYVTVWMVADPTGPEELLELLNDPADVVEHQYGELLGYATARREEDGSYIVQGVSYVPRTAATCTITTDFDRLPWAFNTWRTLYVVPAPSHG